MKAAYSIARWLWFAVAGALLLLLCLLFALTRGLPSAQEVVDKVPPASSLLFDRHGELLYRFYDREDRIPVPLASLPGHLIQAVIAIEDRDFYGHSGFSIRGMARAMRNNLKRGRTSEGGSTITQQLVKNRVLSPQRTLTRKIKELILAVRIERHLDKRAILELYLNQVPWGGASYGIEAAARSYFDKSAADLNLSESAFLAGLLQAPTSYSPFRRGSTAYLHRKRLVLNRMREEGFITADERAQALAEPLEFAPSRVSLRAPHFTMYARRALIRLFGRERLYTQGLRVFTTLNLALHSDVQSIVSTQVRNLFRHWVGNGAALVTDPRSGEILSMVGSVDYFDESNNGAVNATLSLRQPGSAIKPLTYAMALQDGKTAASLLSDQPIALTIPEEADYAPRNIDFSFRGDITLRQALAESRNIPAVNQLVEIGVPRFLAKAESLGISSWRDHDEYRYALTLGSGEVRMIELVEMFSSFPNLGLPVAPHPILRVVDAKGETLYRRHCAQSGACAGPRAFDPGVAFLINHILADNEARSPTFGVDSDLRVPRHEVAVKTGTTDLLRDNWAVGYTTERLVAVWIGNNDGSPMRFIHSGELGASTIWNRIMRRLLATRPSHRFPVPGDIVAQRICRNGTAIACGSCEDTVDEFFVRGTEPDHDCVVETAAVASTGSRDAAGLNR